MLANEESLSLAAESQMVCRKDGELGSLFS
jgi:hypothetical protein